jgi:hypothetical protein
MRKAYLTLPGIVCLAIAWLLSETGVVTAQVPGVMKLEDIVQEAQRRQDKVRSLHFRWTQHQTDAKGSRTLPPPLSPPGEVIPPRDVTYDVHPEVWIDGSKMRFAYENHQWFKEEQAMLPCPYVGTFDGKLLKTLDANGGSGKPYPVGSIQAEQRHFDVGSVHLMPLLMTFRAADPNMRPFDISQMTTTGKQAPIDGRLCRELQLELPATAVVYHLWVDPSRDFVICRYTQTNNRKLVYQVNVRFTDDPQAGWAPSAWDVVSQFPDGALEMSSREEVDEHEINPSISADQFDIVFPPGTALSDLVAKRNYIIKPDGSERTIRPNEAGLSYKELLASGPGEITGERPGFLGRWWVWILAAGIGCSLALYSWAWYKGFARPRRGKLRIEKGLGPK